MAQENGNNKAFTGKSEEEIEIIVICFFFLNKRRKKFSFRIIDIKKKKERLGLIFDEKLDE